MMNLGNVPFDALDLVIAVMAASVCLGVLLGLSVAVCVVHFDKRCKRKETK